MPNKMEDKDFFASRYERREGDFYPTIDTRTVDGLLHFLALPGKIVDPCAPDGSGIVDYLNELGFDAHCVGDAFSDFEADWIVTNVPYKRSQVDEIMYAQIKRVWLGQVKGFISLNRSIFDFAKGRKEMFTDALYIGDIHLCFRVFWSEDRSMEPKHNYVWHIWSTEPINQRPRYYYAPYDERYAVKRSPKG